MASYQDIETRLRVVEDKVDFILKTFTVTRQERSVLIPSQVLTTTMTLLDVYREMKNQGAIISPYKSEEVIDGQSVPVPESESAV